MACILSALLAAQVCAAGTDSSSDVLAIAAKYPDGGGYRGDWKGSGTPESIEVAGTQIIGKGDGGTYCSGFTFAVAVRSALSRGLLADKEPAQLKAFQKEWYGAIAPAAEKQCVEALENLGIGKEVALNEAQPGDFVQLWRVPENGKTSGHSVVLVRLIRERGQPAGFEYRSSQPGTRGIGNRVERFSDASLNPGRVDRSRTYVGRLNSANHR